MEDYIKIWERVRFNGGEAVSWERSFDGKNWEDVQWPTEIKLPFIRFDYIEEDHSPK